MRFYAEKDLALCGLACVLCSHEDCPGCKARGCAEGSECSVYQCATEKRLDGCYQCDAFPCEEKMLQGVRNRAFNRYARQFGKQALLARLQTNYENGVAYHNRSDDLKGDYDSLSTGDEIVRLIHFGSYDPYIKCPTLETERFILRLVRPEDAGDLLKCYSDPKAQALFNADKCTSDFRYKTIGEMQNCIDFWLREYETQSYVRFAIVDKSLGRAVGTIEMFGMIGQYKTPQGVLRLDICSEYETPAFLNELFGLCAKDFFILFGADQMITKAAPAASHRVEILSKNGFRPCEMTGREHAWVLDKAFALRS